MANFIVSDGEIWTDRSLTWFVSYLSHDVAYLAWKEVAHKVIAQGSVSYDEQMVLHILAERVHKTNRQADNQGSVAE